MKILLQWSGLEAPYALFTETQIKAKKLTGRDGLFARFLEVIPGFIKKNFDTCGSRLMSPWPALNPKYQAWKIKFYPYTPKLILTGYMRIAATIPNAPGNYIQWMGNTMLYGVDATKFVGGKGGVGPGYPVLHQYGGTKMPMRQFMGLTVEDIKVLEDITTDYMQPPEEPMVPFGRRSSPSTIWTRKH